MKKNLPAVLRREAALLAQGILAELAALGREAFLLVRSRVPSLRADVPALKRALRRELLAVRREIVRSLRSK